jgi:DnaJ-class molecular chaperone
MQKYTQLGLFDALAAEKYQKAKKEVEMVEWVRTHVPPRDFKRWKAQYDKEKAWEKEWEERSTQPLRSDLEAALNKVLDKIKVSTKPFLAAEYATLGLERGASKREIKNAYRRMARKLHPDKGGSEDAMKTLNAAYKRLLAAVKE